MHGAGMLSILSRFNLKQKTLLPASACLRRAFLSTGTSVGTPSAAATDSIASLSPREGLPRWPQLHTATGLLRSLDWFGTVVFAASGSLTAASMGCDILGCSIIGTITAVGGGTIRDVLVLNKQPFWVEEWEYLVISCAAAAGLFYAWDSMTPGKEVLPGLVIKAADGGEGIAMDWGDAIGVGAFAVIGTMNGIRGNSPALISAICGMMTSTFGGLTRDTLLNRPVRIMHPYADTYAPIAFTTAASYLGMRQILPKMQGLRIAVAVGLACFLRYEAWTNGWRLPFWSQNTQTVTYSNKDPRTR